MQSELYLEANNSDLNSIGPLLFPNNLYLFIMNFIMV